MLREKKKTKIFVATSTFGLNSDKPIEMLKNADINHQSNSEGKVLNTVEAINILYDVKGIIAGTEAYTENTLNQLPNLKVISRLGVGMDNIDLKAAEKKGIQVFKTKTTPAKAVAELSLGLMLDIQRKISKQFYDLIGGTWNKQMGSLLSGKTLGIIGLGTIGKSLVELVNGFNFNLLAFDQIKDQSFGAKYNITYCGLDSLLKNSDIISIHLNLSSQTKNLINRARLNLMKPDSILINTSRGGIVDEQALYEILINRKIKGCGLDVYSQEPYDGQLTSLENVVLTPHIAAYAKEIRVKMEIEAVENLISGLIIDATP